MKRKINVLIAALMLLAFLVGTVAAASFNGIYINGNQRTIKSYTDGDLDWVYPVEGNFSTWEYLWTASLSSSYIESVENFAVYEDTDTIVISDPYNYAAEIWTLSTGTQLFIDAVGSGGWDTTQYFSGMDRYFVFLNETDMDIVNLQVFNHGELQNTLNVTALNGELWQNMAMDVTISKDGKYIFVSRNSNWMALFIGVE